jgi:hypothetical protein
MSTYFFFIDTIHTPSTPCDVDQMIKDFKNTLLDIFTQTKTNTDSMYIDQPPLPSSVTVKGPLNVHQYYDLSGNFKLFFLLQFTY